MTSIAPGGRLGPSHGGPKDPRDRERKTQARAIEYGASGAGAGHSLSRRRRAITRGVPGASLANEALARSVVGNPPNDAIVAPRVARQGGAG